MSTTKTATATAADADTIAVADSFAEVLGTRRGTGAAREHEPGEPSAAARARRLLEWAATASYATAQEYVMAEREVARELGLELAYGRWEADRWMADGDPDDEPDTFALTAVYRGGLLVGLIGAGSRGGRLLLLDDRANGGTA